MKTHQVARSRPVAPAPGTARPFEIVDGLAIPEPGDYVYADPRRIPTEPATVATVHRGVVAEVWPSVCRAADTLVIVVFDDVPEGVPAEQDLYLSEIARLTRANSPAAVPVPG